MKRSFVGTIVCAAIVGALAFVSPAAAKTAKECRAEWTANKAANQAKGITEKAYVDQCKAGTSAEKSKAAPAAAAARIRRCKIGCCAREEDHEGMPGGVDREQGGRSGKGHHREGLCRSMQGRHRSHNAAGRARADQDGTAESRAC